MDIGEKVLYFFLFLSEELIFFLLNLLVFG